MSSAFEVEFVLRSPIPLSEPKVTLILKITEDSFQKWFVTLTLIAKPHCSHQPQTLDCSQSLYPCLSSLLRLCYYNDFVIIKCPHPGSCHDASCLIFLSLSTIISKTVHSIVYCLYYPDYQWTVHAHAQWTQKVNRDQEDKYIKIMHHHLFAVVLFGRTRQSLNIVRHSLQIKKTNRNISKTCFQEPCGVCQD